MEESIFDVIRKRLEETNALEEKRMVFTRAEVIEMLRLYDQALDALGKIGGVG